MAPMKRAASAPLARSRYSSVLESALVGLGRDNAVVRSTRKPRKIRRHDANVSSLEHALSAPVRRVGAAEEEEDPFAHLQLVKKKKKETDESLVVKKKKHRREAGVLEMVGCTPVTRSMSKKRWKRSLETMEQEDVVVQKKIFFHSPEKKLFQTPEKKKEKLFQSPEKKKLFLEDMKEEKMKAEGSQAKNRKAVLLTQWRVQWPPVGDEQRAELVMTGQVDGQPTSFVVAKREGPTKFTSVEGGYVALSGKFDRDAARSAGIPRAAMEMMEDGIPAYFYKRLLPFVEKAKKVVNVKASSPKLQGRKRSKVKVKALGAKRKQRKKASGSELSSPMAPMDEELDAEAPLSPLQDDDVFKTPKPKKVGTTKPKKARAPARVKMKKKGAKNDQPEPEAEADVWTAEQLEVLSDAKLKIPTVASNFWAQVAQFVPGKSAKNCQAKTFERFRSPPMNRKAAKTSIKRTNTEANATAKIARAGSNKFKKQVREFVEEYEKKHVDDLFDTTPSKEGLPELPEFDSIKSPELATPSRSFDEADSDDDDEAPGLLKKLSSRRRDDIDSYLLGINRQHVAGGGVMAGGKVRRVTTMVTPISTAKTKAMPTQKKAVMLEAECGSHSLKGVVSPGGTTHIRVEKDGSSSEEEDQDDYHSSEEEEDFDLPDQ